MILVATGTTKDQFWGIVCVSVYLRIPQIMEMRSLHFPDDICFYERMGHESCALFCAFGNIHFLNTFIVNMDFRGIGIFSNRLEIQ